MLGFAAIVAAAFTAFIGVGSASAENPHPLIGLCKEANLLLCPELMRVAPGSGTLLAKQIGTGKFEGGLFTEECTGAMAKAVVNTAKGTEGMEDSVGGTEESRLFFTINTFTFSGCSPCSTVTVNGLPLGATASMSGPEGEWLLKAAGSATFKGCPFGAECEFGNGEIVSKIEMTATESVLNTAGTELELLKGNASLCGKKGKWKAKFGLKWTLTADGVEHPIFLHLLAKEL